MPACRRFERSTITARGPHSDLSKVDGMRPAHSPKVVYVLYALIALSLFSAGALLLNERDTLELLPQNEGADEFAAYHAPSEPSAERSTSSELLAEADLAPEPTSPEDFHAEDWELLTPVAEERTLEAPTPLEVGQRQRRLRPAHLTVITDFSRAQVTVNGLPYPAYSEDGENEGMVLPAGGPHRVVVDYSGNQRVYEIALRPNEARMLMVELTNYNGAPVASKSTAAPPKPQEKPEEPEAEDGQGRITVYSRPRGAVLVNGSDRGQQTPGTVDVEAGRHEVQVRYEDGEVSEKKVVRVREGSRIKLFFRQSK
ncbi:PEGA domain-containing protein [Lujinxingia sediminis]|uniref:PEGA domain-containing protein n=2 Tax=Lujinxingia sediminis TaxID=2480984 RepID=A0ABY0CRE7_9DELT|nr:PEGA domain-containing protein [Lujinxingia sediminis]